MTIRMRESSTAKADIRLGALRSELETLEDDVKKLAGDVGGIVDNRVHLAIHKAEDVAHRAYRLAEDSATHVADDAEAWTSRNLVVARKTIRAQPLSALAVSIGAGVILGAILARR